MTKVGVGFLKPILVLEDATELPNVLRTPFGAVDVKTDVSDLWGEAVPHLKEALTFGSIETL